MENKNRNFCSFAASLMLLLVLFSSAATAAAIVVRGGVKLWAVGTGAQRRRKARKRRTNFAARVHVRLAAASGTDALRDTDAASIELWMDNYCKANPLKRVDDGGDDLFIELKKRQGSSNGCHVDHSAPIPQTRSLAGYRISSRSEFVPGFGPV